MLTHTAVGPDSRVIKMARSMSDLGWDVIVVGSANAAAGVDLRGARIRVAPVQLMLRTQPNLLRSTRLRSPLAYPTLRKGRHRVAQNQARLDDLRYRIDADLYRGRSPRGARILAMRARILVRKAIRRWAVMRLDAAERLDRRRRQFDSPLDRLSLRWWQMTLGTGAWRRIWPGAWDQEQAYGPILDQLRPDVIHAHDFMMLAVGARAKLRAARHGRDVHLLWDAREYLPGMSPWSAHPRWKDGHVPLEREFAEFADAAVTVSEPLAEMLQRDHDLPDLPGVVLNAPEMAGVPTSPGPGIRGACGLGPETPLVVYSGAAAPQRGLEIMLDALPLLPDAHTAFVVLPPHRDEPSDYLRDLQARAVDLGVTDRVHWLPYVPVDQVAPFLSTGDVGVFPGLPFLNHTISLITKFLEYSQARLPIVVSELRTMAQTVRETGQGEVFDHGDVPSYVAAVRRVLADPDRYRRAYDDPDLMAGWTWERQAEVLDCVYRDLVGEPRGD